MQAKRVIKNRTYRTYRTYYFPVKGNARFTLSNLCRARLAVKENTLLPPPLHPSAERGRKRFQRAVMLFVPSILFDAVIEEREERQESVRVDVQQPDLERAAVKRGVEQPDLNRISVRGVIERSDLKSLLQLEVQNA